MIAAAPAATQVPADAHFRDFAPTGEFLFELDGQDLKHAEVFASERATAYLVLAPELSSPVLINPSTRSVESIHLMKVARRSDGSIDLLADASFGYLGSFRISGQEVVFEVKGETARLKPKPPLLGFQQPEALKDHKPEYARLAEDYSPKAAALETLRARSGEAKVLIYFGTWCPTCGLLVPRVMKVDEELEGSKIEFQYYGFPRQMSDDPVSDRDDVHGMPTGIVYVGGKEIGRLGVSELNVPESALVRMLDGK